MFVLNVEVILSRCLHSQYMTCTWGVLDSSRLRSLPAIRWPCWPALGILSRNTSDFQALGFSFKTERPSLLGPASERSEGSPLGHRLVILVFCLVHLVLTCVIWCREGLVFLLKVGIHRLFPSHSLLFMVGSRSRHRLLQAQVSQICAHWVWIA